MIMEPQRIGSLIQESLARLGLMPRLAKQSAVGIWPEIAGDIIAKQSEAIKIDGDILVVKVYQAAWRHQLTFLKSDLLTRLEGKLGNGIIKDIRFV